MTNPMTDEEEKNLLASRVNSSDDAIFATSLDGTILSWNKGAEMLYGFSAKECIGKSVYIFVPKERQHETTTILQEVAQGIHKNHVRTVRQHKEGHMITVSMTICPIQNSAGEVTAIAASVRGLTAQEMAEPKFKSLLESTPESLIIMDNKCKIAVVNAQTEKLFGYTSTELLNKDVEIVIPKKNNDHHTRPCHDLFVASQRNSFSTSELMYGKRKDGSEFPIEIALSPLETNEGMLMIATIRDITERKKNEQEIRELNKKLVTSAKEAGMAEVATSIIHNIGNVLNSIRVSCDILAKTTSSLSFKSLFEVLELLSQNSHTIVTYLNEDTKGKMIPNFLLALNEPLQRDFDSACKEIVNLNEGFNNISEIVAAQQSLTKVVGNHEKVQLNELMTLTLKVFNSQLEEHNITLTEDYENLSPIYIDKSKLSQILLNLVQNAIEAFVYDPSNHKNKEINISIKKAINDHTYIRIVIHDNGVGIKKSNLENIFTYGYTTKTNGHGIGLYSCAIYAMELGGRIYVESDSLGLGTSFIVELPLQ